MGGSGTGGDLFGGRHYPMYRDDDSRKEDGVPPTAAQYLNTTR